MITGGLNYNYIDFNNNVNQWNNPSYGMNVGSMLALLFGRVNTSSFYTEILLGKEKGIEEIFEGFELKNQTLALMS